MNLLQQIKMSVAKQLAQLNEQTTDKGIVYYETEWLNVNDMIYIFDSTNQLVPAPSGEYNLPDTETVQIYKQKYIVENGVIKEKVTESVYVDKATEESNLDIQMNEETPATPETPQVEVPETPETPEVPEVETPKVPTETDIMRESITKLEESLLKQNEIIEKLTTSYNNLLDERKTVEIKDKKVDNNGVHPALQIAFGKK